MDRWAENCRLRWSTAQVPLRYTIAPPAAYGISPTTLLVHTLSPCASSYFPRLLRPAEDFWTATLLPDGNVSVQPLPLPGIDPAQALRFAAFDARSRTLAVLLDDPDGSAAPAPLLASRAATAARGGGHWEERGVSCQEGAVSVRRFRVVERPDSPPGYLVLQPLHGPEPPATATAVGGVADAVPERVHYDPTRDDWRQCNEVSKLLGHAEPSRPQRQSDPSGRHRVEVVYADLRRDMLANVYVVRDAGSGEEVGRMDARHHPNSGVQAFAGDLLLLPGESSGEDAFYKEMRLFNWRTGALVRRLPLDGPGYIEVEWPRGLLPGSSQTFFTVGWTYSPRAKTQASREDQEEEGDGQGCSVFFLSPQPGDGGEAPVDDGQVAGGSYRAGGGWTTGAEEEAGVDGAGEVAGV